MSDLPKIYPLSAVTKALENLIARYAEFIWIKAEIVKLNYYGQSGHCYPDLVEKVDGKIIAEIRGNIWNDDFININNRFKEVLNENLGDGMTIVCLAKIKYSSVYGLSLNIIDINPEYTLGELAKNKAETIRRLQNEGIYYLNKTKILPLLPKTLAIISVSSSKGYQDFIDVISKNSWSYKFHYKLFPAILQGPKSITTITQQLKYIEKYAHIFDAVAIIRGGGGDIGLSSFDNYELASVVANYPLPVLTGIGHSTNLTVTEIVSYQNFITPTKIAEFLLQQFHNFSVPLKEHKVTIEHYINTLLDRNKTNIKEIARLFNSLTLNYLNEQKHLLDVFRKEVVHSTKTILTIHNNTIKEWAISINNAGISLIQNQSFILVKFNDQLKIYTKNMMHTELLHLKNIEQQIRLLSPYNILQRGFSITTFNGKSLTGTVNLKQGDKIITRLATGQIDSTIDKLK